MTETYEGWDEDASEVYRMLAKIAVPGRREQLDALLCLIPFGQDESFTLVDLGCGEGVFSYAVLDAFPNARVIALDGSESMRQHASALLQPFGSRARIDAFDLESPEWLARTDEIDCVASSLVIHHLDGEGKQELFRNVCQHLSERGALLIADLVQPLSRLGWNLYAEAQDEFSWEQSAELTDSTDLFDEYTKQQWNYYRFPDPFDKPSPLPDQLTWLKEAGFAIADCFWLQMGHAVYGGYKSDQMPENILPIVEAIMSAKKALEANENM